MLMLQADILKKAATRNDFIGHIGGDDFIVICDYHEVENYCEEIIERFSHRVSSLYHKDDMDRGYIISKNRRGITEEFPIASLSVAGISNRIKTYKDIEAFSTEIAELKKKCKRFPKGQIDSDHYFYTKEKHRPRSSPSAKPVLF